MPVPPNQRRKTASVMTLPSGVVDAAPGVLRVTGMPRGGTVHLNGNDLPGIGWADPAQTQYDVQAGPMSVVNELRITDNSGVNYVLPPEHRSLLTLVGQAHYVSFSDFVPIEGTLRVNGAAHMLYVDDVPQGRPQAALTGGSADYVLPVGPHRITVKSGDGTNRQMTTDADIAAGMRTVVNFAPDLAAALAGTNRTRRSITDVSADDSIDRSNNTGAVFSITGVPSDVVSLIVQENARVLSGTLAGGMWTASSFDVSDAAVISVQPTTAGGVMGEGLRGRALTRTVAIPAAGLSIAYSTLAAPTTQYRRVSEGGTGSLTVTGEPGWVVALAASGSTTPIAASPIPSSGSISIPVPVGSYNLGVQNANGVRAQSITVTSTGLTVDTRTFAATPAPPAMTGIVLVGDTNSIGGATFSLDGVAVPYAPGAAQWLPTTPAYTKLFIPAPAGAHVVRLIKGGDTRRADAAVAAGQVTEIPVSNMTVETRSTTQQVTNSNTGIVLVGDTNSIGGATFSLDGVAVPYALGAAQWLPTTPAYTKLFIPATAGARVVRLIKGGQTLIANATVAAGQVTEIPVTEMQQELIEIQKSEDPKVQKSEDPKVQKSEDPFKSPTPLELRPPVGPVGPIEVYPDARFTQPTDEERRRDAERRQPAPQPGMSMTSKLIIGGLVAAALGGGYYWYSMQPKANPGKKDCGCGCKGGCGG